MITFTEANCGPFEIEKRLLWNCLLIIWNHMLFHETKNKEICQNNMIFCDFGDFYRINMEKMLNAAKNRNKCFQKSNS